MARVVHLPQPCRGRRSFLGLLLVAGWDRWLLGDAQRSTMCCTLVGMFAFMASISQKLMFKLPGCPCIHVLLACTVVSFIKNKCEGTCTASGQGLMP